MPSPVVLPLASSMPSFYLSLPVCTAGRKCWALTWKLVGLMCTCPSPTPCTEMAEVCFWCQPPGSLTGRTSLFWLPFRPCPPFPPSYLWSLSPSPKGAASPGFELLPSSGKQVAAPTQAERHLEFLLGFTENDWECLQRISNIDCSWEQCDFK